MKQFEPKSQVLRHQIIGTIELFEEGRNLQLSKALREGIMKNKMKQNKQEGSRRSSQAGILKFGGLLGQKKLAERAEASNEKAIGNEQLLDKV